MTNSPDGQSLSSLQKIKGALLEELKSTNWMAEIRYFLIITLSVLLLTILIIKIFDGDPDLVGMAVAVGVSLWVLNRGFTTRFLREDKKNYRSIIWCIWPERYYPFDEAQEREYKTYVQDLVRKHGLNLKEHIVLSMIQALYAFTIVPAFVFWAAYDIALEEGVSEVARLIGFGIFEVSIMTLLSVMCWVLAWSHDLWRIYVTAEMERSWKCKLLYRLRRIRHLVSGKNAEHPPGEDIIKPD
ncbi:MAG: hypothetical protein DDT26_01991 [Dehalococcoidia bacterium]|nr:hypothetical protein [Chloroflexota bacterium]